MHASQYREACCLVRASSCASILCGPGCGRLVLFFQRIVLFFFLVLTNGMKEFNSFFIQKFLSLKISLSVQSQARLFKAKKIRFQFKSLVFRSSIENKIIATTTSKNTSFK